MPVQAQANLELIIGDTCDGVAEHIAAPGMLCGNEERQAAIYRLIVGLDRQPLTVSQAHDQEPVLAQLADHRSPLRFCLACPTVDALSLPPGGKPVIGGLAGALAKYGRVCTRVHDPAVRPALGDCVSCATDTRATASCIILALSVRVGLPVLSYKLSPVA